MGKKYRVISIDNVMSELRLSEVKNRAVVYWTDRLNGAIGYVSALTLAKWIDICDHDNSDNRYEFYIEEETED